MEWYRKVLESCNTLNTPRKQTGCKLWLLQRNYFSVNYRTDALVYVWECVIITPRTFKFLLNWKDIQHRGHFPCFVLRRSHLMEYRSIKKVFISRKEFREGKEQFSPLMQRRYSIFESRSTWSYIFNYSNLEDAFLISFQTLAVQFFRSFELTESFIYLCILNYLFSRSMHPFTCN